MYIKICRAFFQCALSCGTYLPSLHLLFLPLVSCKQKPNLSQYPHLHGDWTVLWNTSSEPHKCGSGSRSAGFISNKEFRDSVADWKRFENESSCSVNTERGRHSVTVRSRRSKRVNIFNGWGSHFCVWVQLVLLTLSLLYSSIFYKKNMIAPESSPSMQCTSISSEFYSFFKWWLMWSSAHPFDHH